MRYYIYLYHQIGNIGPQQLSIIDSQPKEGFKSETEAESHLLNLIEEMSEPYFQRDWYKFTILKTWRSKCAVKGN